MWLAQAQWRWEASVPASPRPPLCAGGDFLAPAGAHGFLGRRWKRPEFGERSAGGAVLPPAPEAEGNASASSRRVWAAHPSPAW